MTDNRIEIADIFSELRMYGFTEQEIEELKLTKRSLAFLRAYRDVARNMIIMNNEDIEKC